MARFRGTLQGSRGEVSRLGHASTGLTVKANGWDAGITVETIASQGEDCSPTVKTKGATSA